MIKINLKHENARLIIITVFLLLVMLLTFGISLYSLSERAQKLDEVYEEKRDNISQLSAATQELSEYQKAIDLNGNRN